MAVPAYAGTAILHGASRLRTTNIPTATPTQRAGLLRRFTVIDIDLSNLPAVLFALAIKAIRTTSALSGDASDANSPANAYYFGNFRNQLR